MANVTEVVNRSIDMVVSSESSYQQQRSTDLSFKGHINPDVPPLTEKQNVFNRPSVSNDANSVTDTPEISEKKGPSYVGEMEEDEFDKEGVEVEEFDPFVPFNDLPDERKRIVTIRAMLTGVICGALVNASNLYLGLKTGWTFSANLFGAIVGFSVLKFFAKILPQKFPIFGGDFGPRENNIVQTAATAAGGLSSVFISGIPALYYLDLLGTPQGDFGRLIPLTIVGGYFGEYGILVSRYTPAADVLCRLCILHSSAQVLHHLCRSRAPLDLPNAVGHCYDDP